VTGGGGLYLLGGVGKIEFVKVQYNSLLGTEFGTNTAIFKIPLLTNGQVSMMSVTRTNTAPDIIFTAANLSQGAIADTELSRSITFVASTVPASPGGGIIPSVMSPAQVVTFNNIGPIYYNETPYFLTQDTAIEYPIFIWGSFDGSTNAPIVFPQGTSLTALEEQAASGGGIPLNTYSPEGSNSPVESPIIYQEP